MADKNKRTKEKAKKARVNKQNRLSLNKVSMVSIESKSQEFFKTLPAPSKLFECVPLLRDFSAETMPYEDNEELVINIAIITALYYHWNATGEVELEEDTMLTMAQDIVSNDNFIAQLNA